MLLTFFFMAVSWIQSWRFNNIKHAVKNVLNSKSSISMYKDCNGSIPKLPHSQGNDKVNYIPCRSLSSSICLNQNEAFLSNLLFFSPSKRVCSVLPQQQVDINNWIAVPSEKTEFPLKLSGHTNLKLDESHVFIIIESDLGESHSVQNGLNFEVEYFGIPKSWYVGDLFVLLLESDLNRLAELTTLFLSNNLCFSNKLEITRIESVEVRGEPCKLSGVDLTSITRRLKSGSRGVINIKDEQEGLLSSHRKLYSAICEAATNAVSEHCSVTVSDFGLTINPESAEENSQNGYLPIREETDRAKSCDIDRKDSYDSLSLRCPSDSVINHSNSSNYFSECGTLRSTPLSQFNKSCISVYRLVKNLEKCDADKSGFTSMDSLNTAYSTLSGRRVSVPHHGEVSTGKPPVITIFSSSSSSVENVRNSLHEIVERDRYTIHSLNLNKMISSPWLQKSKLVIICGNVPPSLVPHLLKYLVSDGGQILCICSDLLGVFLSSFQTAEVRPDEIVRLNYDKWKHVPLMHHIFCYQPSPTSDQFPPEESLSDSVSARTPSSVEVIDMNNESHTLLVKVLGVEETWHTPSFLLATCLSSEGKVLFSQVHLDSDPVKSEIYSEKPSSDKKVRLEILADLLLKHFDIKCCLETVKSSYTPAYFLGNHEQKLSFLEDIKESMIDNGLKIKDLAIKFYGKGQNPSKASENFLPILLHSCPARFSTVEYFDNLKTKEFGRLVIYSDILKTSMALLAGPKMANGLAVIPRLQTRGSGRAGNEWLSPEGSASYSIQLHISLDSELGQHLSLLQHIVSLASVHAIVSKPGYERLSLGLKWPNDIYAGDNVKIGGVAVNTFIYGRTAVCNIGAGLNLSNSLPTTCINDMVDELSQSSGGKLKKISHESYFAWVFNELELFVNAAQEGRIPEILDLYYQYWLHENAEISVVQADGSKKNVTIVGLDKYGFLEVRGTKGEKFSVQPDGNSFDMFEGLIAPK
ncbi:biotin--protein ligase isoform X1 [Bemisia tabaci]|uniref:biotin--protein ligase isoform X1 n=1 Tax=Bemisia tabaci TaxID=7038 RepID=UPI003B28113F